MALVGIVVGSKSDEPLLGQTMELLGELNIEAELVVASAHRTPERLRQYVQAAPGRGIEVFIAAAGGAAALPGVVASMTTLPVIGVPLASSDLKGIDALHSIVQMPPGVPVACMAVGTWGARNAAVMVAQILALKYDTIRIAHDAYRHRLNEA
jgi:5-(carboxyamino)imidazole ribonucleotide mutase